ncbi:MAG: RNA methyltransferase [Actinomycetota bacterium]|nr:RNA methyltransferase [Actinomycetota bacterium]
MRKRNYRYREKAFLVEGMKAVVEALYSPFKPECLLFLEDGIGDLEAHAGVIVKRDIPCYSVNEDVISHLATTVTPQGVIAVSPFVHRGLKAFLDEAPSTILVADRVRDPGNLGNMVRAADASGTEGMIICRESADIYNPKTVRSTAGSIFHLPLVTDVDIAAVISALKDKGHRIFAADAHDGSAIWDVKWPEKVALVMGNEAWGIPREDEAMADEIVHIPIFGRAESLNVAAAAAVILFDIKRRLWPTR